MSEVNIFAIPRDLLNAVWGDALKKLKPAVDQSNGRVCMDDLYNDLDSGISVLWMVRLNDQPVAYYTTRITSYPGARAMVLEWIGGSDIKEWMNETIVAMRKHAEYNACSHIEFTGREGWTRLLKDTGWKPEYVSYRMELKDG